MSQRAASRAVVQLRAIGSAPVTVPVFYARPEMVGGVLSVAPALASWDGTDSPGQVRSAAFVAEVGSAVTAGLRATADPLALRLDIGLPDSVPLLAHNDLDNYLFPLVPKLSAATGRQFATVWASKRHAAASSVAVCQARIAEDPGGVHSVQIERRRRRARPPTSNRSATRSPPAGCC